MKNNTFKIGYLPLSKVNWTNDTLEAARENAMKFLRTLPGVEVMGPDHMLALEGEAIDVLDQWEKERPDLIRSLILRAGASRTTRSARRT